MSNATNLPTAKTAATYVMNVVEALKTQVLPQIGGTTADRLGECMTILARVAHDLQLPAGEMQKSVEPGAAWSTDAAASGAVLDAGEDSFRPREARFG